MELMKFYGMSELNALTTAEIEEHLEKIESYHKRVVNKLRERRAHEANLKPRA